MTIPQKYIQQATQAILKGPIVLSDLCGMTSQLESRKQHAILPEILFVGSTNVGKSSLLSKILTPRDSPKATPQKPRDIPNVSKKKGFTKTLNFYTINNAVRLVDSPGYGYKSTDVQGEIVNEYLQNYSQTLRQVFILAHAVKGLSENDISVAALLASYGIPFDVILTKIDICKDQKSAIENAKAGVERSALIDVYATSSSKDIGINELRGAIWRSLG